MPQFYTEDTSTTSFTSGPPSCSEEGSFNHHIGDIVDNVASWRFEGRSPDENTSQSSESHDDSITYDSYMEEIRKAVWEKVQRAKAKRKKKAALKSESQECMDGSGPSHKVQLDQKAVRKTPQLAVNQCTLIEAASRSTHPTRHSKFNWNHLARPAQKTSGYFPTSSPTRTMSTTSSAAKDEREMIWDGIDDNDNLQVVDEELLNEPSEVDLLERDLANNTRTYPVVSSSKTVQALEAFELDSVFESILSIEFEPPDSLERSRFHDMTTAESESKAPPSMSFTHGRLEPFLTAKIFGSRESTFMCIPIFLVERRENEMFQVAFKHGIRQGQWNGSLLCTKFKSLYNKRDQNNIAVTIELHPESESTEERYRHGFQWQFWMNECIDSFYKTGCMHIPDVCTGADILDALQYFRILYTPNQLLFDSFATYLRVKLWSEYYARRHIMADWVLNKLNQSVAKHSNFFITCPNSQQEGCHIRIGRQVVQVFEGGMFLNSRRYGNMKSSQLVHSFFNENADESDECSNVDVLMREDFCNYFQHSVPGTKVSFPKKLAIISHPDGTKEALELSTLCIHVDRPKQSQGKELAYKDDEETTDGQSYTNSVADSSARSAPAPTSFILESCRRLDPPTLAPCRRDQDTISKHPLSCGNLQWIPVDNPDFVLTSSYSLCKESNDPDRCTSSKQSKVEVERPMCTKIQDQASQAEKDCKTYPSDHDTSEVSASTVYTTLHMQKMSSLMRCQHLHAPTLAQCQPNGPPPSIATDQWIPVRKPGIISTTSCRQHIESNISNLWKQSNDNPSLMARSGSMSVQYLEPLPTVTDPSVIEIYVKPHRLDVAHIYEDLWLQDVAFQAAYQAGRDEEDSPTNILEIQTERRKKLDDDRYPFQVINFPESENQLPKGINAKGHPFLYHERGIPSASSEHFHRVQFANNPNHLVFSDIVPFQTPQKTKKRSTWVDPKCVMNNEKGYGPKSRRHETARPKQQATPKEVLLKVEKTNPLYGQGLASILDDSTDRSRASSSLFGDPTSHTPKDVPLKAEAINPLHGQHLVNILDDCTDSLGSAASSSLFGDRRSHPMVDGVDCPDDEYR